MASQSVARSESIAAFIPELERLITEAMDEWKVPGLATTVVQNGEVALIRAYGLRDVEAGLRVTTDTHFLICSITKSFTATGLALLMDERRVGTGLHPGIPAIRRRGDRPHHSARFALPSLRTAAPRLDSYAQRSVTRANAGGNTLFGAERRHSQHPPIFEPRLSRCGLGG